MAAMMASLAAAAHLADLGVRGLGALGQPQDLVGIDRLVPLRHAAAGTASAGRASACVRPRRWVWASAGGLVVL